MTPAFWRRFIALATPTVVAAVRTRSGAEPSDRTAVLAMFPAVVAVFWVTYPAWSRFFQVEPTRMTLTEFVIGGLGVGAVGVILQGAGLPALVGVPCGVVASAALAHISATLTQRERVGDTSTSFFAD